MGKKKMSGSREPRKPKKEKAPKMGASTVANILRPTSSTLKNPK